MVFCKGKENLEMSTEQSKWREFLQPLVVGLVALLSAATLYLQRSGAETADAWQGKTDQRLEYLEQRSTQRDVDMDNLRTMMGDVRSDVSYIRGLLEKRK